MASRRKDKGMHELRGVISDRIRSGEIKANIKIDRPDMEKHKWTPPEHSVVYRSKPNRKGDV